MRSALEQGIVSPMKQGNEPAPIRLSDLLAGLSLATDLANDMPLQSALRTCLLATRLARRAPVPEAPVEHVYYAALLRFVGCTAYATEAATLFDGNDNRLHALFAPVDPYNLGDMLPLAAELGGTSLVGRASAVKFLLADASRTFTELATSTCEVAVRMAHRLGMSPEVCDALSQIYERWDGRGKPGLRDREHISWVARVLQVARMGELHLRREGRARAIEILKARAGGQLDPNLVTVLAHHADELFDGLSDASVWDEVMVLGRSWVEPAVSLDTVASVFADMADLKSAYTLGHSAAVAVLVEGAATELGLDRAEQVLLRRAALLHDLGRVGVATGIWDKPGKLDIFEKDRVRQHSHITGRILLGTRVLAPIGEIAMADHERLDGSGYPRMVPAAMLPRPARVLAAADVYQALIEDRPHRPAHSQQKAREMLEKEVAEGKLDPEAVRAVLRFAGHKLGSERTSWPSGLSEREVEVLRWVARGRSNKEVAALLDISPRTVGHHIRHIYDKIGVSTRAAAALFAMENGLLPP
jgi:HD-GYP domain-containing protein (c-di-GMP phosphodiesterase class II)/DNA-binding CsgD family transcriptional regulator